MLPDPFPGDGQDGEEPEGSGPLPAGGDGSDAPAPADAPGDGCPRRERGRVCLCALSAGELTLAGFVQDGTAYFEYRSPDIPMTGTVRDVASPAARRKFG